MALDLEPEGWSWIMEPGEEIELIFEKLQDLAACESLVFTESGATFWEAFPLLVVRVLAEEREELMRRV